MDLNTVAATPPERRVAPFRHVREPAGLPASWDRWPRAAERARLAGRLANRDRSPASAGFASCSCFTTRPDAPIDTNGAMALF
jgi:hypothetical protein